MWTIVGIGIAALAAIASAVSDTRDRRWKMGLVILAAVGGGVGILGAKSAAVDQERLLRRIGEQTVKLTDQERELGEIRNVLKLVDVAVGDLAVLDRLSGGATYYVRIAADTDRGRLRPYLDAIEKKFKGAGPSDMTTIREPRPGSKMYELVFGQHLSVAAAEVFHRLAMSHQFPPPGHVAEIWAER